MSDIEKIRKNLIEMMDKFPRETIGEVIKAVTTAGNVEEVKKIVRGYGEELTDEQAEILLKAYSEEIVLSDEDLDKVSGGVVIISESKSSNITSSADLSSC